MAAKTSTRVAGHTRLGRFLLKALLGPQGVKVAGILDGRTLPHVPEGETAPGFLATIRALAHTFQASLARLVEADDRLFAIDAELTQLRELRDRLISQLAAQIVSLRLNVSVQFLAPRLDRLGFENPVVHNAELLLRQSGRIGEVFQGDDLEALLGEPSFPERPDLRIEAAQLRTNATRLRGTLGEIDERRRLHDEVRLERNDLADEHEQLLVHTARPFESYCRLAGEDELADRLRPATRQPRGNGQGPDEIPEIEDAPDPVAPLTSGDAVEPPVEAAPAPD